MVVKGTVEFTMTETLGLWMDLMVGNRPHNS